MSTRFRFDSLPASVLSLPGMCTTVSQTLRDMHHSQICLARRLFSPEWHVPIWFIIVMAVVLFSTSLICLPEIVPSNDFSARKAASISRWLISCAASSGVQFPPVVTVTKQQPHPVKDASVVIMIWGSPWLIRLNANGNASTHHLRSVLDS